MLTYADVCADVLCSRFTSANITYADVADVCADVLCSRFTDGFTLADLTAQTCKFYADANLSAAAVAAKGEVCFGTAGLHSQVCVISIVHDGIRRKICTTARAVAFVYCCNAAFVFFEIIRVVHVCSWQRAAGPTVA